MYIYLCLGEKNPVIPFLIEENSVRVRKEPEQVRRDLEVKI